MFLALAPADQRDLVAWMREYRGLDDDAIRRELGISKKMLAEAKRSVSTVEHVPIEDDERSAWARYAATRSIEDRNALVERYVDVARKVIRRQLASYPPFVDRESLDSVAMIALLHCVEQFEPRRGFQFMTFAARRINGAIVDELRRQSPGRRRVSLARCRAQAEERIQAAGGKVTDDALCAALGWTPQQLQDSRPPLQRQPKIFAHSRRQVVDEPSAPPAPELPQLSDDRCEAVTQGLSLEERTIVYLYFWRHAKMSTIGEALDLSESRVSQMLKAILERLRERGVAWFEEAAA